MGCGYCVVHRNACLDLLLTAQFEMKLHLGREIVGCPVAVEQHADAS